MTSAVCLAACGPAALPPVAAPSGGAHVVWSADPDDTDASVRRLGEERVRVLSDTRRPALERVREMAALGLWDEAEEALRSLEPLTDDLSVARGELRLKQHRYGEAEALATAVLDGQPGHPAARRLQARLLIQAWELAEAARLARQLLLEDPADEEAALLLGRVYLLRKDYEGALEWARDVQALNPDNAEALLLEAETLFWDQDPAAAEEPLRQALAVDPFNADARFSYGYAIWRRVDATQLDAMAAHWELALAVNPFHYRAHWHWGNGHTNRTYADYAHPTDSIVRDLLKEVDELIASDRIVDAVERTRQLDAEHDASVLPAMVRGSAFYMAYDMELAARLDSAQATFLGILDRKAHYGPAHNGLAAVIKQRQFNHLGSYDSLDAVVAATSTPPDAAFDAIFPDVAYYPGDRVAKMVRAQLGPSRAYLPMLARFGRTFAIPPLHRDLADAMGRPSFRTTTTFDNRQWMDIRGVGSGATGIEYVERGAHWERNVLAHEYTHLFHGRVFTDQESRRVRELYNRAMEEGRTLDYYASNNESEFLAQAYPAYMAPVKVHALNHKSMNTRDDLSAKDPETFAFVESLMIRQQAFLDGDSTALASNWAHVFMQLSEAARDRGESADSTGSGSVESAAALLDTALMWDPDYVPAYLSKAALLRDEKRFDEAREWIERARGLAPRYGPAFRAVAELAAAELRSGRLSEAESLERQLKAYEEAIVHERDYSERARLNASLRELHRDYGHITEALDAAEEYTETAPVVSTYLRDRRDEAATFAHAVRNAAGYSRETLPFFEHLVGQKPQHFGLRSDYADALASAGRPRAAIAALEEAQRVLRAGGRPSSGYMVQTAEFQLMLGDSAAARAALEPLGARGADLAEENTRYVRVLASLGEAREVDRWLAAQEATGSAATPRARADVHFTRGWIAESRSRSDEARGHYRRALADDLHHRSARTRLVAVLLELGRRHAAAELVDEAAALSLPLGPDFHGEVEAMLAR